MIVNSNIKRRIFEMERMRTLNAEEIEQVSGGWDVAGRAPSASVDLTKYGITSLPMITDFIGPAVQFDVTQFIDFSALIGWTQLEDTDGDGIPDSPPIVVKSPLTHSEIARASQYADDLTDWLNYYKTIQLGVLGMGVPELGAPLFSLDVINVPPIDNAINKGISDSIFTSIVNAGGTENYIADLNRGMQIYAMNR